eukprot:scaffold128653_cov32-Tisochrysis_lutea.AAC.1
MSECGKREEREKWSEQHSVCRRSPLAPRLCLGCKKREAQEERGEEGLRLANTNIEREREREGGRERGRERERGGGERERDGEREKQTGGWTKRKVKERSPTKGSRILCVGPISTESPSPRFRRARRARDRVPSPMTIVDLGAVRAAAVILASASPRRVEILNTVLGLLKPQWQA